MKDALIGKLTSRNEELEVAMRKAVTIMSNPAAMKEAFVKYNLDKIVYTVDRSPSPGADAEDRARSPGSSTAAVPLNTSSDQVLIASRGSRELKDAIKVKNFNERLETSELQASTKDDSPHARPAAKSLATSRHYSKMRESGKRKMAALAQEGQFSPVG